MKILWLSRHEPLDSQRRELARLYGPGVQLIEDGRPFSDARDIFQRFQRSGAQEMVVVAPLSVIRELVKLGVQPLWAEMETLQAGDPRAEVTANGSGSGAQRAPRAYRFSRFRRVVGLDIKFEEVQPCSNGNREPNYFAS